jgi:hypothetical protein
VGKAKTLRAALSPILALSASAGVAHAGTFSVSSPLVLNGPGVVVAPDQASGFSVIGTITGADAIFSDGFDGTVVWDVTIPNGIVLDTNTATLAAVEVPPGEYVAFARLQAETGSDSNPGTNYRLDCNLLPDFDFAVYRVGVTPLVERYVTFQGAARLDSAATISLQCRDGNGHEDTVLSGKMTVIRVGS